MAIRFAVANGNWSNPATWNGGTLPASDDDVFANNFTVTINGTFTVLTIRNTANTTPAITAGGGFTFANGGNLTCSASGNSVFNRAVANVYCLTFDLPSGQSATFNGSVNDVPIVANGRSVLVQNTGTFNMVGNYDMSNGTSANRFIILVNGSAIINIVGNITSSQTSVQSLNHTATTLFVNAGNPTINITGNVTGSSVNSFIGNHQAIFCSTTTTLNITGNITTNSAPSIWFNTSGTLNLIGNATGGNAHPAVFNQGTPATIDILGTTTSGSGYPAIQGLATTFVIIRGNVVHTDTYAAIYAGRIVINDNVTSWQFKDSTNTVTRTLYTPGVALGNPATSNVRNGVIYGPALELTGTAFIPTADNVRKGVPVDATIGTADLTAADMWDYLASNITTAGSIGEVVKNIKTKTDLIPNNPTSNESVGAIVASYNI
jgi:hypothetical protein